MRISKSSVVGIAILTLLIGLSNSGSHPTGGTSGYTGAPGDSTCGQSGCHTGTNPNLDGEVTISGLPTTINTGDTYTLTVTITNPNGNALRAGFQLLALTGTNTNAGSMANNDPNTTDIKTVSGGKKYFGHSPAQIFPGSNTLSFDVDWTAPATTGSNPIIKFYASSVIGSGNNGSGSDRVVLTNQTVPIQASNNTPLSVTLSNIVNLTCANNNTGSATANPVGGTQPYIYGWNNGSTLQTPTNLPAGLAIVTVTDNAGTTSTASTNITSPPALNSSASGSTICQGASNGTASASASGGTGGYSYLWSTGANTSTISNLTSGTYTVSIFDSNGCSDVKTAQVTISSPMTLTPNQTNVSCNGGTNGSITVNVSGGTTPLAYLWSTGANTNTISNRPAGTYTITVTDGAQCTKTGTYTITQPTVLNATISGITNVTCNGGTNGSATINISGGSPSYSYLWSTGASGTGATNTQTNLPAGPHMVTVTDILDCQKVVSFTITQPNAILIQASNQQNVTCFGLTNGALTVSASGTVGTASYLWSNGGNTNGISNLMAGPYTVTVTDGGNNCTKSATFTITQPTLLTATTTNITNVSCNGGMNGSATANGVGGNGGYTYLWSIGGTTNTKTNLASGVYTVTVTDNQNCTSSAVINITQPIPMVINLVNSTPASCLGVNNGSLSVSAINGTSPYNYSWSNGAGTAVVNNLSPGTYTVTATDVNQCTSSNSFVVGTNASFTITQNSVTNVLCNGASTGAASVVSVPNYTYSWSNGATGTSINNVPANVYTVIATNQAGCQSIPLNINITQPSIITSSVVQADTILCPGTSSGNASLTLALSGGTGTLSYLWSNSATTLSLVNLNAGPYTISITDANNCSKNFTYHVINAPMVNTNQTLTDSVVCYGQSNGQISLNTMGGLGDLTYLWSNGATTKNIVNLSAAVYTVTITDQGQCESIHNFNVNQPDSLIANINIINESVSGAEDGAISLTPTGGTSPYTILWSNGETSFTIDSLAPGIYNYQLFDDNDCPNTGFGIVGGGGCSLSATYETVQPICFNTYDGQIDLNIFGDFDEYQVQLYSNNNLLNLPLDSLPSGNYTVIITDSLSCLAIIPNIILTSVHPAIVLDSVIITNPSTSTSKDGALNALVLGGDGPLTYLWTKDNVSVGTTPFINNLLAGIYTLSVIDSAGCNLIQNNISLQVTNATLDEISSSVSIYPNPISDHLNILNKSGEMISKLELFNSHGQIIHTDRNLSSVYQDINLDQIGNVSNGVYYLKLNIGDVRILKKFVVLK